MSHADEAAGGHKHRSHKLATKRSLARLRAVQALYQWMITQGPVPAIVRDFLTPSLFDEKETSFDVDHFSRLVQDIPPHEEAIRQAITQHLDPHWPLDRVDKTLAAILYAATYELLYRPDIPLKVILNEYINVTHAFFDNEDVPRAVNGTLDALAKAHRASCAS